MSYINPPPNSNLNLQNNNPIIENKDDYFLDRKLLTVHSEDRNYSKWKYSNEFEIDCPQSYTNIQSMRLTEISFPSNFYNFSENLQNTKFKLKILNINPSLTSPSIGDYTIDISNGYYTDVELANTLTNRLNKILKININILPAPKLEWKAVYYKTKQKILIGNNADIEFALDNTYDFSYNIICGYDLSGNPYYTQPTIDYFDRYSKFSLLSYIGYNEKKVYYSNKSSNNLTLEYLKYTNPEYIWLKFILNFIYFIEPPLVIDILGNLVIYMEIDYFNSYDELIPWPDTSGNTHCYPQNAKSTNEVLNCPRNTNPKWSGIKGQIYKNNNPTIPVAGPAITKYVAERGSGVKSSFAKIPIIAIPKTNIFSSTNGYLYNLSQYNPPIERISKFKFKFRYHDGKLVDFQNNEFNFTLEINQLRNEIKRNFNIRTPQFVQFG